MLAAELNHVDKSPLSYVDVKRYPGDGSFLRSVGIANALGESVLRFDSGDSGQWIASGWTERNGNGRPTLAGRPFASTSDPIVVADTAGLVNAQGTQAAPLRVSYDFFGRRDTISDDFTPIQTTTYGANTITVRDAEQLPGGRFDGASETIEFNGRGAVRRVQRTRPGQPAIVTTVTRNGLDQPVQITRTGGTQTYTRKMVWDFLGRLWQNSEPNTAVPGSTRQFWRYAWDASNRLIGTSDARGCGKDLAYDGLGRVLTEWYSPCLATQPILGASPSIFYTYDTYETGQVQAETTFQDQAQNAAGRLVAQRDRGAFTQFNYDNHGRVRRVGRQIIKPFGVAPGINRFASPKFFSRTDYDLLDRSLRKSSGADDPNLWGPDGKSEETYGYSARGLLQSINSSYGPIIRSIDYEADGLTKAVVYGDVASTQAGMTYDARRRLASYDVTRVQPALWGTHSPPEYPQPGPETTQTELAKFTYAYDLVGNPTLITDSTNPNQYLSETQYPIHKRNIDYDDLYRVTGVTYRYPTSSSNAAYTDPYRAEFNAGDTRPVPLQLPATRVHDQAFSYDALGNVTQTTDDLNTRYDRSLLAITHGTSSAGPNQFVSAPGVTARHDPAGNLIELKVERSGGFCPQMQNSRCAQWFAYDWDEVGQLMRARRWDYQNTLPVLPTGSVPSETPAWDLRFAYSMGVRVLKSVRDSLGGTKHTVDIFDSLRLNEATYAPSSYQHDRDSTEVFLGGGIARAFYDTSLPRAPGDNQPHVYLQIGDHLGSSVAVIDKGTSELVERPSHQAYGALESNYRPTRWASVREPLKFTGKEEDLEIGLTYFGARYYASRLNRWASADPLTIHGLGSNLNPYAYVSGRVMSHVDPLGLCSPDYGGDCIGGKYWPDAAGNQSGFSVADPDPYPDAPSQNGLLRQIFRDWAASGRPAAGGGPTGELGLDIERSPILSYGTTGENAGSAGGVPNLTPDITHHSTPLSEHLKREHPALAPLIDGAGRQEMFIKVSPLILSILTMNPAGSVVEGVGGGGGGVVTLWKAPQPGRASVVTEVVSGYSPKQYPGMGPFFTTERSVAQSYQFNYQNGLQEINIPAGEYHQLTSQGIIRVDGLAQGGVHVPAPGLPAFNRALRLGPPNVYHPEGTTPP